MSQYRYIISIGTYTSEPVTAKKLTAISEAFGAYPQSVTAWNGEVFSHEFDLAAGEGIIDWAEAQLEDVQIDGGFDGAEEIVSMLRDILFIR